MDSHLDDKESPIALVAMGGHAFISEGDRGSYADHERNAEEITSRLMHLVERGYRLAITHGNGPQVGSLLLQQECSADEVPAMPLDVLVAMTEGSLGYVLQKSLINHIDRNSHGRFVVTVVTQVVVDGDDPAFKKPTKPIGPMLDQATAETRRDQLGWQIAEDPGRGWRRVVPSPRPQRVLQRKMIGDAVRAGHIVVAAGGGGIPVIEERPDEFRGVEAVIDKDLTSSVLAQDIGAELLVILTAVPQVYLDYGKSTQRALGAVTLEEIERYRAEGNFPAGSMGPKTDAVIEFLKAGGKRALITDAASLPDAMEGRGGTHFIGRI